MSEARGCINGRISSKKREVIVLCHSALLIPHLDATPAFISDELLASCPLNSSMASPALIKKIMNPYLGPPDPAEPCNCSLESLPFAPSLPLYGLWQFPKRSELLADPQLLQSELLAVPHGFRADPLSPRSSGGPSLCYKSLPHIPLPFPALSGTITAHDKSLVCGLISQGEPSLLRSPRCPWPRALEPHTAGTP